MGPVWGAFRVTLLTGIQVGPQALAYAHLCAAFSTDGCNSHREWRLLVLPARERLDPQNDEFVHRARHGEHLGEARRSPTLVSS